MAERIAGPFEVPWSVGLLPDGSFLVTERPGRLQHVTQTAGTYAVDGVPPVLYSGHGGLLDVEVDPNFEENGTIYLSYLQGEETASIVKVMRARFDADHEALDRSAGDLRRKPWSVDPSFSVDELRSPATDICSSLSAIAGTRERRRTCQIRREPSCA